MNLYIALHTNHLYHLGDSITQDEYNKLVDKSQFTFWYNTSGKSLEDERDEKLERILKN